MAKAKKETKKKEVKEKGDVEMKQRLQELSSELYKMQCELKITRKIDKPHLIREKKRERARILTALRGQAT